MSPANLDSLRRCAYKKPDGAFCKRTIPVGEGMCWQHAKTLRHKWRALTQSKQIGFCLAVLSVVLGLIGLGLWYADHRVIRTVASSVENDPNKTPPAFSVALEGLSWSPYPNTSTSMWAVYMTPNGVVISPVQVFAWIHIVNNQTTLSMINGFSVEAKTVDGNWVELIRLAGPFDLYIPAQKDFSRARKISVNMLEDTVCKKELQAKETGRGLVGFVYPPDSSSQFTDEYRVSVSDTAGAEITNQPIMKDPQKGTLSNQIKVLLGLVDLSEVSIRPWYETHRDHW